MASKVLPHPSRMPNELTAAVGHKGWPYAYASTSTNPCWPCSITSGLALFDLAEIYQDPVATEVELQGKAGHPWPVECCHMLPMSM